MDALPPNDPNRNNNNNNNSNGHGHGNGNGKDKAKEAPPSQRGGRERRNGPRLNDRGEMEVFGGGNVGDDVLVAAMFLIGAAAFLLREVCYC